MRTADLNSTAVPEQARTLRQWATAALPLLIVLASYGALKIWGRRPPAAVQPELTSPADPVHVVKVESFQGTFDFSVEGVARSFRQVSMSAEVAGRLRQKSSACQEATFVRQGDLLLEIDPADYELAVQQAKSELAQKENALQEWQVEHDNTRAQIELAEHDVKLAAADVQRLQQLATRGGSATAEVERAQRAELTARNTLLTANNQLRLLDARYQRAVSERDLQASRLKKAELDLQRTKIVAPYNGTVIKEHVEQDAYVQIGTPLVVLNDTSAGEVVCQLELDDMVWLWGMRHHRDGQTDVTADQAGSYQFPQVPVIVEFPIQDLVCRWNGVLRRFGGEGLDLETRTVPCIVEVAEPRSGELSHRDGEPETTMAAPPLTPGMFVRVRVQVAPHANLISLPNEGLRAGGIAWTVRDGLLRELPFQIARRLPDRVLGYLEPDGPQIGDEVIISPLAFPHDGMPVERVVATP